MKRIPHIFGLIFSLAIIYGAYTEAGVWTALCLLCLFVAVSIINYNIKELTDFIREILNGREL